MSSRKESLNRIRRVSNGSSASWKYKYPFFCVIFFLSYASFVFIDPRSLYLTIGISSFPRRRRRLREAIVLQDEEIVPIGSPHEARPSSRHESYSSEQQRGHDRSTRCLESFQCRCMPIQSPYPRPWQFCSLVQQFNELRNANLGLHEHQSSVYIDWNVQRSGSSRSFEVSYQT